MKTQTKKPERVKWKMEGNAIIEEPSDELVVVLSNQTISRQIVHEHNTYAELLEALRDTLNCLFPTGQDTKTDRTITKVVQAIAVAEKEEG